MSSMLFLSLASDSPEIVEVSHLNVVIAELPRTIVLLAVAPPVVLAAPFPINVLFDPVVFEPPAL